MQNILFLGFSPFLGFTWIPCFSVYFTSVLFLTFTFTMLTRLETLWVQVLINKKSYGSNFITQLNNFSSQTWTEIQEGRVLCIIPSISDWTWVLLWHFLSTLGFVLFIFSFAKHTVLQILAKCTLHSQQPALKWQTCRNHPVYPKSPFPSTIGFYHQTELIRCVFCFYIPNCPN